MAITLNNFNIKKKSGRRIGRGLGSQRGTYSGRGQKGQRARSGGRGGLKMKGFRANLLNLPKFKGMLPRFPKKQIVKLSDLVKHFSTDLVINPETLKAKGLIDKVEKGIKILASKKEVKIEKAYNISGCEISATAKVILEKAGAKIESEVVSEEKK